MPGPCHDRWPGVERGLDRGVDQGVVLPRTLPAMPGMRRHLHIGARTRLRQARRVGDRGAQHRHHDPIAVNGACAERCGRAFADRSKTPLFHRQPPGRFAASRALQRLHPGEPDSVGASVRRPRSWRRSASAESMPLFDSTTSFRFAAAAARSSSLISAAFFLGAESYEELLQRET